MSTDPSETIHTFEHQGETYEIDHLGIAHPSQYGEFAVYRGGDQVGEFLGFGTLLPPETPRRPLPGNEELERLAVESL